MKCNKCGWENESLDSKKCEKCEELIEVEENIGPDQSGEKVERNFTRVVIFIICIVIIIPVIRASFIAWEGRILENIKLSSKSSGNWSYDNVNIVEEKRVFADDNSISILLPKSFEPIRPYEPDFVLQYFEDDRLPLVIILRESKASCEEILHYMPDLEMYIGMRKLLLLENGSKFINSEKFVDKDNDDIHGYLLVSTLSDNNIKFKAKQYILENENSFFSIQFIGLEDVMDKSNGFCKKVLSSIEFPNK